MKLHIIKELYCLTIIKKSAKLMYIHQLKEDM